MYSGNLAQVDALFVHGSLLACGSADHHINLFDAYTSVRTAAFTAGDGVEGVWAGERGLVGAYRSVLAVTTSRYVPACSWRPGRCYSIVWC